MSTCPAQTFAEVAPERPVGAPPRRTHRIAGLDALRGLAAFSVLLGHYTANYHRLYGHGPELLFKYPWAGYGVMLFFMISGFVILMSAERGSAGDFAWNRFSRLYPAYWTAVATTFAVLSMFDLPGRQPSGRLALVNLTMVQNLLGVGSVDGVYWTLHVEMYFYAIVFFLLLRGWVRNIQVALLGLVVLATADRLFFHEVNWPWVVRLRHVLILDHAYAFLIGVTLYRSMKAPRLWHAGAVAVCLAYTLCKGSGVDFYFASGFTVLMFLTTRGYLKVLEWRPLVFLGTISYSLYLTHQNIGYVIIRAGYAAGLNPNVSVAIAAVAALVIAVAITFGVERPAMSLLRRLRPKLRFHAAGTVGAPLAAA